MPEADLADSGQGAGGGPAPDGGTTAPAPDAGTQAGGGAASTAPSTTPGTTAGTGGAAAPEKTQTEPIRFGQSREDVRADKEKLYQTKYQEALPKVQRAEQLEQENADLKRRLDEAGRTARPQTTEPAYQPTAPAQTQNIVAEYNTTEQAYRSWMNAKPGEVYKPGTQELATAEDILANVRACENRMGQLRQQYQTAQQQPSARQPAPMTPQQPQLDVNALLAEAERRAEAKATTAADMHYEAIMAAETMTGESFDRFAADFPGGNEFLNDKAFAVPVNVTLADGSVRQEMANRARLCFLAARYQKVTDPVAVLLQFDPNGMRAMFEKQARAKVRAEDGRTAGSAPGVASSVAASQNPDGSPRLNATVARIGSRDKPYGA
jgi:hypothetical protein